MANGPFVGAIGLWYVPIFVLSFQSLSRPQANTVYSFCIIIIWLPITWQEHPSFGSYGNLITLWSATNQLLVRPVHAAITALFIAGIVLLAISRTSIPTRLGRGRGGAGREYRSHDGGISAPSMPSRVGIAPTQLTPHKRRLVFSLLVLCTVVRVGTLRKISEAAQCSARDVEVCSLSNRCRRLFSIWLNISSSLRAFPTDWPFISCSQCGVANISFAYEFGI